MEGENILQPMTDEDRQVFANEFAQKAIQYALDNNLDKKYPNYINGKPKNEYFRDYRREERKLKYEYKTKEIPEGFRNRIIELYKISPKVSKIYKELNPMEEIETVSKYHIKKVINKYINN